MITAELEEALLDQITKAERGHAAASQFETQEEVGRERNYLKVRIGPGAEGENYIERDYVPENFGYESLEELKLDVVEFLEDQMGSV